MDKTLYLHILCNRDERTPEDIAMEKEFAKLEIPVRKGDDEEEKVKQEWRPGGLNYANVEGFYPHANNENTLIHMSSGGVLTVKENIVEIINQLKNSNKNTYEYTAVVKPLAVEEKLDDDDVIKPEDN